MGLQEKEIERFLSEIGVVAVKKEKLVVDRSHVAWKPSYRGEELPW